MKGELIYFGIWLDREGHFFDTVHFPAFVKLSPFRGKGIYRIEGRVAEEYGFPSIEVLKMERLRGGGMKGMGSNQITTNFDDSWVVESSQFTNCHNSLSFFF